MFTYRQQLDKVLWIPGVQNTRAALYLQYRSRWSPRYRIHLQYKHPNEYVTMDHNTLRPRQNGRIFEYILLSENVWISIDISLK